MSFGAAGAPCPICNPSDGLTPPRLTARRIRAGLFVLGADEATFDPHLAIMIEDHEGTAAHDVIGIIGAPLALEPVDINLKPRHGRGVRPPSAATPRADRLRT